MRNRDTKLKDYDIDGVKVPIYVLDTGEFWATLNEGEDEIKAPTLKALEAKIKTVVRRKRASIAATLVGVPGWRDDEGTIEIEHITLTGIHATHRAILYRDAAGDSQRLAGYGSDDSLCRRLTDAEVAELTRLWEAKQAAIKEFDDHFQTLRINGTLEIRKAMGVPEEED
jgi:hypothetical protein